MSDPENEIISPSAFCQIGIVVKSVEETVKFYQETFGFGPFEFRNVDYPTATYYGKKAGYRGKRAFFYLGPIEIELIELVDGQTIHEEFLRDKGEGLHHISFCVENLEETKKKALAKGLQVIQDFFRADGSGFAYLDTERTGGVIFELIQRPAKKARG
jgi:methylmalonyl-CoA/ethylmalonyl-CoA epimerase